MSLSIAPAGRPARQKLKTLHLKTSSSMLLELEIGLLLLGSAVLGGVLIAHRPRANLIDRIGIRLLPSSLAPAWEKHLVDLGTLPVLCVAVVVLFALQVRRDWVRAIACLVAPLGALAIGELAAKPLVARHVSGSTAFSYPSGHVVIVAALATAALLAAPRVLKAPVAAIGAILVVMMTATVVILRWHYPTDAAGGALLGAGTVLTVDAAGQLARALAARRADGSARDAR